MQACGLARAMSQSLKSGKLDIEKFGSEIVLLI